jgi:hypothetical protein
MRTFSIVNPKEEISPESWLVSAVNYKGSTLSARLPSTSCHSMLIVEGITKESKPSTFPSYKLFRGRYEIAGLVSLDKLNRVVFLNEGTPKPEYVPQDAILLHKENDFLVTAYWKQGSEIVNRTLDLKKENALDIISPFKNSQTRLRPYEITEDTNKEFFEKIMLKYGCTSEENKKDRSIINKKMGISEIACLEGKEFKGKELHQYQSQSWPITPEAAMRMIDSIKEDKRVCERAYRGECDYPPYQYVGKNHFLSDPDAGDNCAGWAIDQLIVAGLSDEVAGLKTKPKIVAGKSCIIL